MSISCGPEIRPETRGDSPPISHGFALLQTPIGLTQKRPRGWRTPCKSDRVPAMQTKVTRLDYCQYLLVSQINYTLTHFADHCTQYSHDAINRYLRGEQITPRLVWENVKGQIVPTMEGYMLFDDTVLDKNASFAIELVRRQYSGNAKQVIKGIGVVTCVYVHP